MLNVYERDNLIRSDSESTVYSSEASDVRNENDTNTGQNSPGFNHHHSTQNRIRIDSSHGIQVGDIIHNPSVLSDNLNIRMHFGDEDRQICKTRKSYFLGLFSVCCIFIIWIVFLVIKSHNDDAEINNKIKNDKDKFDEFEKEFESNYNNISKLLN